MNLTDVLATVGAFAGISGLLVSTYQSRLVKRDTTLTGLLPVRERYHSGDLPRVRQRVYRREYDFSNLTEDEYDQLRRLLEELDFLGTLVKEKVVDARVVMSLYRNSPLALWTELYPFVELVRNGGLMAGPQPTYAWNYERLVRRYEAATSPRTLNAFRRR